MKMAPVQAKPFKVSHILFRKIHKWVGLILGLQFVLWTFSGAIMAVLDMEKVGGHSAPAVSTSTDPWPADLSAPKLAGPVEGLTLRKLVGRPIYEVRDPQGLRLLDARTGAPVAVDAALAEKIARSAFHHSAPTTSVQRLDKANLEAREFAGPMWRVNFADEEKSSSYISIESGQALVNRGDTWRIWDFVWMLHNMDYVNRTSFNHPLIIFVAFGALWLSFTGFYLLFKSFRRREFRWVLGRENR
jgi:hypothetical protein